MSGYTKGPWRVGKQYGQSVYIDSDAEPSLGYANWEGLAVVHGCDDSPSIGEEVMLANARLIAAAPEMLEALESLLLICDEELDPKKCPEMEWARAAIRRATGEA